MTRLLLEAGSSGVLLHSMEIRIIHKAQEGFGIISHKEMIKSFGDRHV